jgi:hypothetical protein
MAAERRVERPIGVVPSEGDRATGAAAGEGRTADRNDLPVRLDRERSGGEAERDLQVDPVADTHGLRVHALGARVEELDPYNAAGRIKIHVEVRADLICTIDGRVGFLREEDVKNIRVCVVRVHHASHLPTA